MILLKFPPKYIILHTAAFRGHSDVDIIRRWHKEKGWEDIGYHFVITGSPFDESSEIQIGRPLLYRGAHAYGNNRNSIGICMTGHGDHIEWTEDQLQRLTFLTRQLQKSYNIPNNKIIGHRETWYETVHHYKTCPGKLIDMNEIRKYILVTEVKDEYKTTTTIPNII